MKNYKDPEKQGVIMILLAIAIMLLCLSVLWHSIIVHNGLHYKVKKIERELNNHEH